MEQQELPYVWDQNRAAEVHLQAARVFVPMTPISTRELFSGRWDQLTTLADAVLQAGLHVVIYGERGVGKTSLANIIRPLLHAFDEHGSERSADANRLVIKINASDGDDFSAIWSRAFDEITWDAESPQFGYRPSRRTEAMSLMEAFDLPSELSIDHVRKTLLQLGDSVFIIDEFDRAALKGIRVFTDLIKALSDYAIPTTVILVGVADTVDELIQDHASISRALTQIQLPRMTHEELLGIIEKGEHTLGVSFDDESKNRIVRMSQGLPQWTHLVSQFAVRAACKRVSNRITIEDVEVAFRQAVETSEQSTRNKYSKATHSAQKNALHEHILLACALAASTSADELGFFQAADVQTPLSKILVDRMVHISTFNRHLAEFCEENRGAVLKRKGTKRNYQYRFESPLLPSYVMIKGLAEGLLTYNIANDLLA